MLPLGLHHQTISDSSGPRWRCITGSYAPNRHFYEQHFTTPLVSVPGTEIKLEYTAVNSPSSFSVNIIGRLVTM